MNMFYTIIIIWVISDKIKLSTLHANYDYKNRHFGWFLIINSSNVHAHSTQIYDLIHYNTSIRYLIRVYNVLKK